MPADLIQVCHDGIWQRAYVVACAYDFITVRLTNDRYVCIDNGSWGLLF